MDNKSLFKQKKTKKNKDWKTKTKNVSQKISEVTARLEQSIASLDALISEVDKFIEEGKSHTEAPHIIDVVLPFLCSYLPAWWQKGPDNVDPKDGSHITMVTAGKNV